MDSIKKYTIFVNSCDSYEDLWNPFFSLLKKYWNPQNVEIILNTETKKFSFDGLDIKCVHSNSHCSYGERIYKALKEVNTEYTVALLDDFFLRSPVDTKSIRQILEWMDSDKSIAYFNCDSMNKTYCDYEENKYEGFKRLPQGNDYILSMQAAIWRTKYYKKYWKHKVSPWEWELFCNSLTSLHACRKFYIPISKSYRFLDYGNQRIAWGVYRGKWVKEDVVPLFLKEEINVNYEERGFYSENNGFSIVLPEGSRKYRYDLVFRCLGKSYVIRYFIFCRINSIKKILGLSYQDDYFKYLKEKGKKRFLKKQKKTKSAV